MKVCFETFGCRLNRAEALEEEARYLANGWEIADSHSEANVIVVRGCSVTARAQKDCDRLIAHLKTKYPTTRVIVQGCHPQATPPLPIRKLADHSDAALPRRTARAYLKIQDGCSGKCTFCIVPKFRGKSVSVDFEQLRDKARQYVDAGYHEIVVTGCNLSLYASNGHRLPELIESLAGCGENDPRSDHYCRIRIGSLEPGPCALETVDVMAQHSNVCRFLHIPVQSGSNQILLAMNRPYLVRDVENLIEKAMDKMPRLGLGCDVISGFPGETQINFMSTLGLLKRLPFNNVHSFPYSERPGTLAVTLPGQIGKDIRSQRARELANLIQEKRRLYAKGFVGRNVEVIIEDEKNQAGWTSEYLWYQPHHLSETAKHIPRKELATFHVLQSHGGKLS